MQSPLDDAKNVCLSRTLVQKYLVMYKIQLNARIIACLHILPLSLLSNKKVFHSHKPLTSCTHKYAAICCNITMCGPQMNLILQCWSGQYKNSLVHQDIIEIFVNIQNNDVADLLQHDRI